MLQWKLNVPAFARTNVFDPLEKGPVSKDPSIAVTVWFVPSRLVTVTVSPTLARSGLGEKLKLLIVSAGAPATGPDPPGDVATAVLADTAAEVCELGPPGVVLLPQPVATTPTTLAKAAAGTHRRRFMAGSPLVIFPDVRREAAGRMTCDRELGQNEVAVFDPTNNEPDRFLVLSVAGRSVAP
jgi:hypothetical protein